MTRNEMTKILEVLKSHHVINIDGYTPFPSAFTGQGEIKAILLGMDPSTKDSIRFDTVFNLNGKDTRYFNVIHKNLEAIELPLDNLYVQNFCQNYFTKTTYDQQRNWYNASAVWWKYIKEELDEKFPVELPLLVTSELLFHRLTYSEKDKFSYFYEHPELVPVKSATVISGRMVIPFSRHWKYNLYRPEWQLYREKLQKYFQ